MYVTSCTSGGKLPAKIIKKSRIRKFFQLPWIKVEYEGSNLKGPCTYISWMRVSEIGEYTDKT
jgi:hypothetical protein